MDFSTLQTEFFARGFDYLNDAGTGLIRTKRWLNDAYNQICDAEDWPFLVASSSGAAPLTVSDARKVLSVTNTTASTVLTGATERTLKRVFGDVTTTGTAEWWWHDTVGTAVKIYPVQAVQTIAVTYIKIPTDLSAGGDTAIVPTRYHDLIVDGAVRRAYEDSDNYQAAQAIQQEFEQGLQQMRVSILRPEPGRDTYGPTTAPFKAGEIAE